MMMRTKPLKELRDQYFQSLGLVTKGAPKADVDVNLDNVAIGELHYHNGNTEVAGIFVHPDYRKQGYGQRLMNELHLHSEGIVWLRTHWTMPDAIRMYQRIGYSIYDYTDTDVFMELRNGNQPQRSESTRGTTGTTTCPEV